MAETSNYKLYVSSNNQEDFLNWRDKIAGETGSNFHKIDDALKSLSDDIDNIPIGSPDAITIPAGGEIILDSDLKETVGDGPYTFILTETSVVESGNNGNSGSSSSASGVGKSTAGETCSPTPDSSIVAATGAEIFNDYRDREFDEDGNAIQGNVATGRFSHAEGVSTTAAGNYSHAEGYSSVASGTYSHAEGVFTEAAGEKAHAEGWFTKATEECAHAEGQQTEASAISSHAEGYSTKAIGLGYTHAEGVATVAEGIATHAEGYGSHASWDMSHAEGDHTIASADGAHSEGYHTLADMLGGHAGGRYNKSMGNKPAILNDTGTAFVIGNGSSEAQSNAFRITYAGGAYAASFNPSGADYAEMFEWQDGNPEQEDRVGLFVTLSDDKIELASVDSEYILGVVSATPSVVGDTYDDQWKYMYETDIFGRPVLEEIETERHDEPVTDYLKKLNTNFDAEQEYIPRSERPEWDAIGMVGKILVKDDGSCEVNSYCKVGHNGIATSADSYIPNKSWRVIKRITPNIIKIILK